jgi:hypothetical protein
MCEVDKGLAFGSIFGSIYPKADQNNAGSAVT